MAIYMIAGLIAVIGTMAQGVSAQAILTQCKNDGFNSGSIDGHVNMKVKQTLCQENDCFGEGHHRPPG